MCMTANDIRPLKQSLRAACKEKRRALSETEKARLDRKITNKFLNLFQYREAEVLLCYVSTEIEVDTFQILRRALQDGKTVAVPRCVDGTCEMDFYVITDFAQLEKGAFGVLEPNPALCEKLTDFSQGLCVVPALSYDLSGYRLGYGKGYYDRFLSRFSGETVGLVYENCLEETLPHGKFDRRTGKIVTEARVINVVSI
ncbi:MAG: 5-formyltetrahydrofolate cyclo-ligase [Candidatus Fimenecus sp.]